MKFLISLSDVEDEWDALPAEERERVGECHSEFERALGDRRVARDGLRPSGEARTVRMRADGGFYIIEAESMDEAVEWAKRGRFRVGANEVREIRED